MTSEELLIRLAAVFVLGVAAQWAAWRLRLPSLLLLLLLGLLVGPATGFIDPDEIFGDVLTPLVSLSVAVILLDVGLSLRLSELPKVDSVGRNLIGLGVPVTWGVGALFARFVLDLEPSLAVLVGAVLAITAPTAIGPLLEHVRPSGDVTAALTWEGMVIGPLGALLAVLVFEAVLADKVFASSTEGLIAVGKTLAAGTGFGMGGAVLVVLLHEGRPLPDALRTPVMVAAVVVTAAAADTVQSEAGLFAAAAMGIALANQSNVKVGRVLESNEGLGILLIGFLFLLLAARVRADDLTGLGPRDAAFLAALVLVARPVAVALSTLRSRLSWRERAMLAWMAPRGMVAGALASIFALRFAAEGEPGADRLVSLVFLVVIGTIVIYGLTGPVVARWLGEPVWSGSTASVPRTPSDHIAQPAGATGGESPDRAREQQREAGGGSTHTGSGSGEESLEGSGRWSS